MAGPLTLAAFEPSPVEAMRGDDGVRPVWRAAAFDGGVLITVERHVGFGGPTEPTTVEVAGQVGTKLLASARRRR